MLISKKAASGLSIGGEAAAFNMRYRCLSLNILLSFCYAFNHNNNQLAYPHKHFELSQQYCFLQVSSFRSFVQVGQTQVDKEFVQPTKHGQQLLGELIFCFWLSKCYTILIIEHTDRVTKISANLHRTGIKATMNTADFSFLHFNSHKSKQDKTG